MVAVQSHILESDFAEFTRNRNPDLTETLDWIGLHLNVVKTFEINWQKPEDVFNYDDLDDWADCNGYVDEREVVSKEDIRKLLKAIEGLYPLFDKADEKYQEVIDKVLDIAAEIKSYL